MANILIVEDNTDLAFGLRINLEAEGHYAIVVETGADAVEHARSGRFDLILLDLMLPDMSGYDVLRIVRALEGSPAVVVLSARTEEIDRVTAFRLGADDYVAKPFGVLELLERVAARLRTAGATVRRSTGLEIHLDRRELSFNGHPVKLTATEFDLAAALIRAEGAVLSKRQLLQTVWRAPPDLNTRTVDYHVRSLARKLEDAGLSHVVRVSRGRGVSWAAERVNR